MTATRLLTAEEFFCLPEPPGSGKMELVCGQVVIMAPVGAEHGDIASGLDLELRLFVRAHDLGRVRIETGYKLASGPDVVLAPDISFHAAEDMPTGGVGRAFVDGPPTLAVEVASPGDRQSELRRKAETYIAAGAKRAWVVDPRSKTVTVHRPGAAPERKSVGGSLISDDAGFVVEGFDLPLAQLFA